MARDVDRHGHPAGRACRSFPKDYGEAAEVFGATTWQRFRHVTLPLLRPSLQVALILRTILAFQVFAVVIALAGRQLPVLAEEAYHFYYDIRSPNVAAAYALLIMLLSLVFTVIYLRVLRVRDAELRSLTMAALSRHGAARPTPLAPVRCCAIAISLFMLCPIYLIAVAAFTSARGAQRLSRNRSCRPHVSSDTHAGVSGHARRGQSVINSLIVGLHDAGHVDCCSGRRPAMRWRASRFAAATLPAAHPD